MSQRSVLMDENDVRRALMRISHQIVEKNKGIENVHLVGIRRRGVPLAAQIRKNIADIKHLLSLSPCKSNGYRVS